MPVNPTMSKYLTMLMLAGTSLHQELFIIANCTRPGGHGAGVQRVLRDSNRNTLSSNPGSCRAYAIEVQNIHKLLPSLLHAQWPRLYPLGGDDAARRLEETSETGISRYE
jgi:hypothetical protein